MIQEFREFLLKQNAIALAIGVIIGAAVGKVVSAIVENVLNPILGLLLPGGDWRTSAFPLRTHVDAAGKTVVDAAIAYGPVIGAVLDFVIIGFVVFLITKSLLPKVTPSSPTKECPQCREIIPKDATRCKACTQTVV